MAKRRRKKQNDEFFMRQQRDLILKMANDIGLECGLEDYPDYLFEDSIFGDIICADCSTEIGEYVKTYEAKPVGFINGVTRLSICPRCKKVFRFTYIRTAGFEPQA